MHGRFHRLAGAGLALTALSGCVQATRHSNTMLFGTNTTFGLKAGTAAGNVPEVVVGYDRQEAVILPLVANTAGAGGGSLLDPCDMTAKLEVVGAREGYLIHPCSLVAYKGGSLDSYSVLASFGAEFSASANTEAQAGGGLAQYFATGMAAQILAARGGAALVSTAQSAVDNGTEPTSLSGLFPQGTAFARPHAEAMDKDIATLRQRIRGEGEATLDKKIKGFLAALASPQPLDMTTQCTSTDQCLVALDEDMVIVSTSPNLAKAVAGWDSY